MKRLMTMTLMACAALSLYALPRTGTAPNPFPRPMQAAAMGNGPHFPPWEGLYLKEETARVREELATRPFGELSLGEMEPFQARLSLAAAKDGYVARAAASSFMLPGSAQFRAGEGLAGMGFLGLHLIAVGGTLVGGYFMLPANLRFDAIDYLNVSLATIDNAWMAHSIVDYLPTFGFMIGGAILDGAIRGLSAHQAVIGARRGIDSGSVKVEPLAAPTMMGFSLRY